MKNIISIIIPVRNEENYIKECIESILNFDYPKELLEVIFVDGDSNDRTIDIIKLYQKDYYFIKILKNNRRIVPISMNMGIVEASGDYVCRLDAHAKYPVNYISKLLEWSQKLNADNVGVVCETNIKSQTNVAKSIKFVMSDKFGIGNSLFRIGIKEALEVDTVPFGFFKKSVFEKIGLYNERLVRTQDLELNKRLKNNNGEIYLIPDIKCTYYPRENYNSFFRNRFETGRWVILSAYFTNSMKSISIRHIVPLIFCLILITFFLLGFLKKNFLSIYISLFSYSIFLFFRSLRIKKIYY